jgi:dihydrofolate reductase
MADFAGYNAMPKYVVSTTLAEADWAGTPVPVLRSLQDVEQLKDGDADGSIIVHGSATLARGLAEAGLVDRYHLLVFPVLLGGGRRLFGDGAPKQRLTVVEAETYRNGITKLVLDVVHESLGHAST